MTTKRTTAISLLALLLLTGCSRAQEASDTIDEVLNATEATLSSDEELLQNGAVRVQQVNIVCTEFPQYDWVRNIAGKFFNVTVHAELLPGTGESSKDYRPSASELSRIRDADLLIYSGDQTNSWVSEVFSTGEDDEEEHNHEEGDEHSHETTSNASSEHQPMLANLTNIAGDAVKYGVDGEANELVYMSLVTADDLCTYITMQLCSLDPNNTEYYVGNLNLYCNELQGCLYTYKSDFYTTVSEGEFTIDRTKEYTFQDFEAAFASTVEIDTMLDKSMDDVNSGITYLSVIDNNLEAMLDEYR